tara:strand:- start:704 stop:895 length:192 start_codon:yes stop_codon:yes gene_type:complete
MTDEYRTIEQKLYFMIQAREVHAKGLRSATVSERLTEFHTKELLYYNKRIIELMEDSNAEYSN